ncbi:hypothetical protein MYU61_004494 [Salmonella enterica subsp. enterica serovar Schwarzengrund]|nr:hypothetical protein [Salmonella enterica subsp. enterica serovar Schwarzengrund]EMC0170987.1 hypothetical protein [Salmonella enterica subsp. enterica serovar Schwarzengrund]
MKTLRMIIIAITAFATVACSTTPNPTVKAVDCQGLTKIESINRYSAIKLTKTRINTTTGKVQYWYPTSLWVDADHFDKVVCK